jgi:hypothetical protein
MQEREPYFNGPIQAPLSIYTSYDKKPLNT